LAESTNSTGCRLDWVRCPRPNAFPAILYPASVSSDLPSWSATSSAEIRHWLQQSGALLFRGFEAACAGGFPASASALCRTKPAAHEDLSAESYQWLQSVSLHSRGAEAAEWPLVLVFQCLLPASELGMIRLVDNRRVLEQCSPSDRELMGRMRVTYIHNMPSGGDGSWESHFRTEDPRQAERQCRERGLDFEWRGRGELCTRATRPLLRRHPVTGEEVLFQRLFPSDGATAGESVLFENGPSAPDDWLRNLKARYDECSVEVRWQQGDTLVIDNMLVSHGRTPLQGPFRLRMMMGDMLRDKNGRHKASPSPHPKATSAGPIQEKIYPSVYHEVLARAREHPAAIALKTDARTWPYSQLVRLAAGTAAKLDAIGVGAGDRVAILGPATARTIAAILGAWRQRCAIVLLDPSLPLARQRLMVEAAGVKQLLYEGSEPKIGPPGLDLAPICALPPTDPTSGPKPGDDAYVFFTSGTTGEPKAILGRHNSLAHFLDWQRSTFGVGPGDRVAQVTGFSFDVVLRDIFLPLVSGGVLCLPPRDADPLNPWPWLIREAVTRLHVVPSLAAHWIGDTRSDSVLSSLKTTFFAGEPLTDGLIKRWRSKTPEAAEVINLYGPTETTLAKFWYRVPAAPEPGVSPIGEALPGCEALLLDGDRPCVPGETGEIVIRTPYRTRGHLGSSDPFVPNPLSGDSSDLVYRTGDLGRLRPDGMIDILGRIDDQIKIRGVRIEPQEVMVALARHPAVRDSFVMRDPDGGDSLLGYVTVNDSVESGELVRLLSASLPPALVPREILVLDRMPLGNNGKVDRRALPLPGQRPGTRRRTPPLTRVERELAELWQELLGVKIVHREDSFLALGGHSLLAARLLAWIRDRWGPTIGIRDIYVNSALCDLARLIERHAGRNRLPRVLIRPRNTPLPASFSQQRLWYASREATDTGVYNIPGSIRLEGHLNPTMLERALKIVAARQEALRTRFEVHGGLVEQVIEPRTNVQLRQANLIGGARSARELALEDSRMPFDLSEAPLARFLLIRESETASWLVFTLHHTIADGRSVVLFVREVEHCYLALSECREPSLPDLQFQYADYAQWERTRLESSVEPHLRYWDEQLRGAPHSLALPTDAPRPDVRTYHGASDSLILDPQLAANVAASCANGGLTPFMVMMAVFRLQLGKLSGRRDLCVGTPVANRQHPDADRLIGCFINTVVIRIKTNPEMTFRRLLGEVKERTLEAFDHQEAPFEQVVARVAPPRDPSRHPLFQVLLNVLYSDNTQAAGSGLQMERDWLVVPETKFDLTLYVRYRQETVELQIVYNQDLFSGERIRGWLRDFSELLERCLAKPEATLNSLEGPAAELVSPPEAEAAQPAPVSVQEAPTSVTEGRLAEIWAGVLGVETVGRSDHFFELGGYSLLAMRVLSKLQDRCGVVVPPFFPFRYPVLRELADAIDGYQAPPLPPIKPAAEPVLSPEQETVWRHVRSCPDSCVYNVPRAVRIRGSLDSEALERALNCVVARHKALRTVYSRASDGPSPRLLPDVMIRLRRASASLDSTFGQLRHEARQPFDLTADAPVRALLLQHGAQDWTLAVTMHHIAADCWSAGLPFQSVQDSTEPWSPGIVFSDLFAFYRADVEDQGPVFPAHVVEYSDVAAWRQENRRNGGFREHSAYWREQLGGAPFRIPLPLERPRPLKFGYAGARSEFAVPTELFDGVRDIAARHRTTPFAVLLTAYGLWIQEWTGARDFVAGTPVPNRFHPETRSVVGLMSSTIPIRIRAFDDPGSLLCDLTSQIHESARYQDFPFEFLIEDYGVGADSSYPPQTQLRFVMQQIDENSLNTAGLEVTPVPIDRGVSRHDLSLVMALHGARLRGWCEYNTELFAPGLIKRVSQRYLGILKNLVDEGRL
jgi:amino acid adenylation domain-containing protein